MDGQEQLVQMWRYLPWGSGLLRCWAGDGTSAAPSTALSSFQYPANHEGCSGNAPFLCVPPLSWDDAGWRRQGWKQLDSLEWDQAESPSFIKDGDLLLSLRTQLPTGTSMQGKPDKRKEIIIKLKRFLLSQLLFIQISSLICLTSSHKDTSTSSKENVRPRHWGQGHSLWAFTADSVSPNTCLYLWHWLEIPPTEYWSDIFR